MGSQLDDKIAFTQTEIGYFVPLFLPLYSLGKKRYDFFGVGLLVVFSLVILRCVRAFFDGKLMISKCN